MHKMDLKHKLLGLTNYIKLPMTFNTVNFIYGFICYFTKGSATKVMLTTQMLSADSARRTTVDNKGIKQERDSQIDTSGNQTGS